MLLIRTFSARILLSFLLLNSITLNASIFLPSSFENPFEKGASITIDSQLETANSLFYEAVLKDTVTSQELGRVVFSYDKSNKSGYIARLHVSREQRKNSYGSRLLKFALEKLTNLNCIGIYWQAYPFDLSTDQTQENMLPKLIAFYQRHGAHVISQTATSAHMAYYPKLSPQIA